MTNGRSWAAVASALALAMALQPSLSAAQTAPAPTQVSAHDGDVWVVESLYRAFAAGDGPGIAAVLAPDLVWMEAEGGPYADLNPYRGPGAVFEGVFGRIGQEWTGFAATPATVMASGARVIALGRYTGVNVATGEALDAQFAHVFTLSDGKVVGFQQYTDTAQWVDASTAD